MAQYNYAWTHFVDGPTHQTDGAAVTALDADGYAYTLGTTALETNSTGADFILAKISPTGARVWTQAFDGAGNGQDIASDLVVKDGYVYIAGRVTQPTNWYADSDLCVIKYRASDGQMVWSRSFSGEFQSGVESSVDGARALAVDNTGNVFVTGFTWEWSYYFSNADYCTVKYNADGVRQWVKKYHGGATYVAISDQAYLAEVDSNGDLIVSGESPGPNNATDTETIKYDGDTGDVLWANRVSETNIVLRGYPASMRLTADGDCYLLIKSFNDGTGVVRYDGATGATEWWWNAFPGHFGLEDAFQLSANEDPVIAMIYDPDVDDSNFNNNLRVIRLDRNTGVPLWNVTYGNAVFGDYQAPRAMIALPDDSVVIVGHGAPTPYTFKTQFWQYDATGAVAWTAFHTADPISLESRQIVRDPFGALIIGGQSIGVTPTTDLTVLKYAPQQEFAPPTAIQSQQGQIFGGSIRDLYASDDQRLTLLASDDNELRFEAVSQSQFATAAALQFTMESRAVRGDLVMVARAKNQQSQQWETLGTRLAPLADAPWTIGVSGVPNRFIKASSKTIETQLDWIPAQDLSSTDGWTASIDLLQWTTQR